MPRILTSFQHKRIVSFARVHVRAKDFNHGLTHMELTVKLAWFLARAEGADVEICETAAYLHDVGRHMKKGKHGVIGARMAREVLSKLNVAKPFIDAVCYAIAKHDTGGRKRTKEAMVLWDADKLQSVGPYGFLRIYAHHLHYDTNDLLRAAALTRKKHRFFHKRFHTKTGKRIAEKLHGFMEEFHRLAHGIAFPRRLPDV